MPWRRLATLIRPSWVASPPACACGRTPPNSRSEPLWPGSEEPLFLESVADPVKGLQHVEGVVDLLEFLPQALDVAVDRAVVDIDLIVIGGIHQRIAALDHAGTGGDRLQDQKLGNREGDRLVPPGAGMALRVHAELAALQHLGGIDLLGYDAVLATRAA